MRLALAFALFFAGAQAASAAADPCAKFSDADAYNNCLARSGPLAGEHKVIARPTGRNPSCGAARKSDLEGGASRDGFIAQSQWPRQNRNFSLTVA